MSEKVNLREVIGKSGKVFVDKGEFQTIMCKPKILPLKSITLERIEEMEAKLAELNAKQAAESAEATGF